MDAIVCDLILIGLASLGLGLLCSGILIALGKLLGQRKTRF